MGKDNVEHQKKTGERFTTKQALIAGFAVAGPVGALISYTLNKATATKPQLAPLRKGNPGQFIDDVKSGIVPKISSSDTIVNKPITTPITTTQKVKTRDK